jgi:hypothetical protein
MLPSRDGSDRIPFRLSTAASALSSSKRLTRNDLAMEIHVFSIF